MANVLNYENEKASKSDYLDRRNEKMAKDCAGPMKSHFEAWLDCDARAHSEEAQPEYDKVREVLQRFRETEGRVEKLKAFCK